MIAMYIFYRKLLPFVMALIFSHTLSAQEKVSKKIEKTYTMTQSGELHLDNKYGDIIVTGWDKNSLAITIDITVNHRKRENAEKLLDRIVPNIKTAGDFVSVSSEITEKSTSIFSRYFNKANPFDFDKSNVQINYTVYLPIKTEMDITSKFGDIIIEDWQGKLKAKIEHGDVWINENLNNVDIAVKYGKLRAKDINYGNIRLKNGSIDMEESKDLRLNSSGSNITIEKVSLLEMYSSKDHITIGEIGRIRGDIRFTTIYLNEVKESVNLTLKITDFKVSKIHNPDVIIDLNQESAEIDLNILNFAFSFNATLEEGLLRLPKSFKNIDTKIIDKGRRIREINASYGKNPTGKISINGKKGVILLKEG
ncbi:MAG: hypothetical protein WBG90_02140 [Saonia sp.]